MGSSKFWLACAVAVLLSLSLRPSWGQASGARAKSYVEFGIANGAKGDYNAAIAAFDAALEIDPKFTPAYYFRGMARSSQKDDDGALADYAKAIELDPKFVPAYFQRGTIEGKQANFDAAIGDFQQVIKLDPKNAGAHFSLGHVYYFRGDIDGSLSEINLAINLQPEMAAPYFIRGLIKRAQDRQDEATKDFQKGVGMNFPYAAIWYWMVEMDNGQHGLAEQDLSTALGRPSMFKPGDWPSQIGNFLLDKISLDQLIALAAQGDPHEIKEQQCEAYFYGGVVKHLAGDDAGANELYQKAVTTDAKGSEEYVEAKRQLPK